MYCNKCGQKLIEGASFCNKCGNKLTPKKVVESEVTKKDLIKNEEEKIENAVVEEATEKKIEERENAVVEEKIEETKNEVVNDAEEVLEKKEENSVEEIISKEEIHMNPIPPKAPIPERNEKVEPTPIFSSKTNDQVETYTDMLAGVVGFAPMVPLILGFVLKLIVSIVFGILVSVLYNVGLGFIARPIQSIIYAIADNSLVNLLWWVVLIAAIAAIAGLVYTIFNRPGKDITLRLVAVGVAILALVSAIGGITHTSAVAWIFALLAAILGIELFMKVYINHEGLDSKFEYAQDISQLIEKIKEKNAVRKEQYAKAEIAEYAYTPEIEAEESFFDGTGIDLFVKRLLLSLISFVTCGIGAPFMLVNIIKWEKEHTVIQGKRQTFNGTAMELFGLWIKWFLLSIITCGVYASFATVDYHKWINSHTGYVGLSKDEGIYADSTFEGNGFEYYGYSGLTGLIALVTCGLATPWVVGIFRKWFCTIIRSEKYFYDGVGSELLPIWLLNVLLTFVTCGLFGAWATVRMNKYLVAHTHVDATYTPLENTYIPQ